MTPAIADNTVVKGEGISPRPTGNCMATASSPWSSEPWRNPVNTIGPDQCEASAIDTARLFQSGRSQAVRLPEAYRFSGTEVIVKRFGNGVLLLPIEDPWQTLEAGLAAFEPGFQLSREQPEQQQQQELAP